LTDEPIVFANTRLEHSHGRTTASLDRIKSSKGYTQDNVQWTHKVVNIMKKNMTEDEFCLWCERVVNHRNRGAAANVAA